VKITRPIVGILLSLAVFEIIVVALVWSASFFVTSEASRAKNIIDTVGLVTVILTIPLIISFMGIRLSREAALKRLVSRYGGNLRALTLKAYWSELPDTLTPFVPRWLPWVSLAVVGLLVAVVLTSYGRLPRTIGDSIRLSTMYRLEIAVIALPYLVSKWRELSQPVTTTSPEVRSS
jgi:hypothetical protein